MKRIIMIIMMAASAAGLLHAADIASVSDGNMKVTVNTGTLGTEIEAGGVKISVSKGAGRFNFKVIEEKTNGFVMEDRAGGLMFSVRIEDRDAVFEITAGKTGELSWPIYEAREGESFLWLMGDGRCIPVSDDDWIVYLQGGHELMHSPMWGWTDGESTSAWIAETPFRSDMIVNGREFRVQTVS